LGSSNVFIRSMLNVLQLDISKWLKTHEFWLFKSLQI
jgi:hypothetical protein